MKFSVMVLGANSAIPTANRFPTSQVLNVNETYYLVDCGEGTQIQLRKNKIKFQRITAIFISHLHGDHYFGLIGLLNTMHLLKREKHLTIVCPEGLKAILQIQFDAGNTTLNYPINFQFITFENGAQAYTDNKITVEILKLNHRINCAGFVFTENKKEPNINKSAVADYQLTTDEIKALKRGDTLNKNGVVFGDNILDVVHTTRKYAYVTDTKKNLKIIPFIENADLLYHEATFLDSEKLLAKKTFHCTTLQAADIANRSKAKQLMIGHYSARYNDLDVLLEETKTSFQNTVLALEGKTYELG